MHSVLCTLRGWWCVSCSRWHLSCVCWVELRSPACWSCTWKRKRTLKLQTLTVRRKAAGSETAVTCTTRYNGFMFPGLRHVTNVLAVRHIMKWISLHLHIDVKQGLIKENVSHSRIRHPICLLCFIQMTSSPYSSSVSLFLNLPWCELISKMHYFVKFCCYLWQDEILA